MSLPRVLIYGQSFNNCTGGGITLSNLFAGWDKDRVAVAAIGHLMHNVTTTICTNYYLLGNDEFRWRFPLNLLQKKFKSGILTIDAHQTQPERLIGSSLRRLFVEKVFYPTLHWFGFYHCAQTMKMSDRFKAWVEAFNPDILYLQFSTRETILFASALNEFLKVPSIIHFMDDWPSTINSRGLMKRYWYNKIDKELKTLINKTDLHLSISDAMSAEFERRYNKKFTAFHNPIDLSIWRPNSKVDFFIGEKVKILYAGRIGPGIENAFFEVVKAIESLNKKDYNIKFHIQSASIDTKLRNKYHLFKSVVFNPAVDYRELPLVLSNADLLVIANDFDNAGRAFVRYSMPTKASEYMISGTPILVYSPEETAVSQFFIKNECGYCVSRHSLSELKDAFISLIGDEKYRMKISYKAVELATERFDASKVRLRFQEMISN